jgi:transcriptional regulator with XRE-family HTH domain
MPAKRSYDLSLQANSGSMAARIRAARAYAGLRQNRVAELLGISVAALRRIEAGETRPDPEQLDRLAVLCSVPVEFMRYGFEPLLTEIKKNRRLLQRDLARNRALIEQIDERTEAMKTAMEEILQREGSR